MPRKTAQAAPYTLMTLACTTLQVDAGIQPRLTLNSEAVESYATLYKEDEGGKDRLPAIDVFQEDGIYYVSDGFHRLAAAMQAERQTLPCQVYIGTRRDAMVHAAFANVRGKVPYRDGDKQQILERLLADADISKRSDRSLASDFGVSHMTVWRTRARLAEEARLQQEIAALPATAKAPKAREQEQLATYLGVTAETLQQGLGIGSLKHESPQTIIKDLARHTVMHGTPAPQAAASMAKQVEREAWERAALPKTPRPSMTKAAIAERQAEKRQTDLFWKLRLALHDLAELSPLTPEELGREADAPPTAEELVAAVPEHHAQDIAAQLSRARTVLEALCAAWQTRTDADQAAVLA